MFRMSEILVISTSPHGVLFEMTHFQFKDPPDTADKVCPPSIQFRIINPVIVHKLNILGTIAP